MSLVKSNMMPLGTQAPDFSLVDTQGSTVELSVFAHQKPVAVMFICNHCPYVIHIIDQLNALAREYRDKGFVFIAISSNSPAITPADAPEAMVTFAEDHQLIFPYLYDESQVVAKEYQAVCTPDFFLFNGLHQCIYRGRFDGSTPGNKVLVTGDDLKHAMDCLLDRKENERQQMPSMGCSIKWAK